MYSRFDSSYSYNDHITNKALHKYKHIFLNVDLKYKFRFKKI